MFKLIFYPLLVLVLSWAHYLSTYSLRVDFNPIEPFSLRVFGLILLVVSYILYYYQIHKIIFEGVQLSISYRKLAYSYLVVSFFTLPIFSNDFFSLLTYSDSFLNGHNIYVNFNANYQSQYVAFINPSYAQLNCKYGPLNVLLMSVPVLLGKSNLFLVLFFSKLIFLIFSISYVEVSVRFVSNISPKYIVLLLTPMWFIQGLGHFHNDLIGLVLIALGYYALIRGRVFLSIFLLVLAALSKLTFVFFLALPYLYHIEKNQHFNWNYLLKLFGWNILILAICGVILYLPFVSSFWDIIAPLQAMNGEQPSSTFADLTSYIVSFFNHDLQGNFKWSVSLFKKLGIVIFVILLIHYFRNYKKRNSHLVFTLSIFSVLIFVYSHRFLPWYLMVIPMLVNMPQRKDWLKWLFWISFWAMLQDFAIYMGTDNLCGQGLMIVGTVLTVLSFFYLIKSRFLYD